MRLIDANALFVEFENVDWYNNADRDEIAERLVLQAPTINAVSEWIPCLERLPTWGHSYCLITYVNDYSTDVLIDCWDDDGKGWCDHQGCDGEVIAWMPLTEPYKKDDDDE